MLATRRSLRASLGSRVNFLDLGDDVLAFRREGGLVCVLNSAGEAVEVALSGELVLATADGAEVADGSVTVPAASTVWLRESS
jgi:alpha-glucosidase